MKVGWAPWRMELIEAGDEPGGQKPDCIFCAFPAAGDDAGHLIVHRTEHAFVILNKYPYNNGHVMVVPYAHVDDPSGLDEAAFAGLNALLRETIQVLRRVYAPQGLNVGMNLGRPAGAGVPGHIHWHVVPRWEGDTNFMPVLADTKIMPEHLRRTFERLQEGFGGKP